MLPYRVFIWCVMSCWNIYIPCEFQAEKKNSHEKQPIWIKNKSRNGKKRREKVIQLISFTINRNLTIFFLLFKLPTCYAYFYMRTFFIVHFMHEWSILQFQISFFFCAEFHGILIFSMKTVKQKILHNAVSEGYLFQETS